MRGGRAAEMSLPASSHPPQKGPPPRSRVLACVGVCLCAWSVRVQGPGTEVCVCACVRQGRRGCACVRLRMWVMAPSETLALAEPMVELLEKIPGEGASEVPVWSSNPASAEGTCGPGWEMGNPASKGLVGVLGGWRWADPPVNTALGWSERPMPPAPPCDVPSLTAS